MGCWGRKRVSLATVKQLTILPCCKFRSKRDKKDGRESQEVYYACEIQGMEMEA